ncbi:ABC transporter permease [Phocaeicola sp.]|uniref:ABC transporter permease n=1 Tax=Phocaeicola sp. TaxID=2773926 RepID=UPI003AEF2DF7
MIDLIQEIFGTIKRNKLRTFLTGFAVAWGIFMLIVLLGAGNGLIHAFESSSADMAMNSIKVFPGWTSKAYDGLKEGRRIELDNKDYRITETDFLQNVISVGATVRQSNVTLTYGQDYVSTTLEGVYPNHKDVERVKPAGGRFINDIDIRQRRKVIILHTKTAEMLFKKDADKAIGIHHRFTADDKGAIWIWNRFTQFLQQEKGMRILTIAIWVIGIFTLLSGIVGVSNIMLITVKERTREFGIRKALGAKPISILWLIIAESVTITTFFGYIGMVAGIAATEYMNTVAGNQTVDAGVFTETVFLNPTVDISIAIQATMTLVIAGTLAGFFPARKAVMIRPIEALRAD